MSYIFISYSHKDKEYANKLEEVLKQRGFEVWLDDRIDYGSEWPDEIEKRLDGCKAMILIMTAHSRRSDWVQNELARAKQRRKSVFPLLLDGNEPWLAVAATQYVDVRGGKLPAKAFYDTLAKVVLRKRPIDTKETSEEKERKADEIVSGLTDLKNDIFLVQPRHLVVGRCVVLYSLRSDKQQIIVVNIFAAQIVPDEPIMPVSSKLAALGWSCVPSLLEKGQTRAIKEWTEHNDLRDIAYSLIATNSLFSMKPSEINVNTKDGLPPFPFLNGLR